MRDTWQGHEVAINPELVHRKITLILEDLEKVRSLASLAPDEYLSDPRNEVLAERYLERIIGRAIDINYHLVTETLLLTPKDYWDSFIRLSEIGVLAPAAARSFARLAGLRNRITHEYNGLDETLIHEALGQIVRELPEYLRQVTAFIGSRG
jgi:uncharacterized protein YutE (UPF0331/DUF86 family)